MGSALLWSEYDFINQPHTNTILIKVIGDTIEFRVDFENHDIFYGNQACKLYVLYILLIFVRLLLFRYCCTL